MGTYSLSRLSATKIFDRSILFNFVITVFYFNPYLASLFFFLLWAFSNSPVASSFSLSSAALLRFAWKCTASFYDTKTIDVFQTPKAVKKPEEKPTPAVTEPPAPKGTKTQNVGIYIFNVRIHCVVFLVVTLIKCSIQLFLCCLSTCGLL